MFEVIQFLLRLQDALGDDVILSVGVGLDLVMIQASWVDDLNFVAKFSMPTDFMESPTPNELVEQMIVQHLQNEHKMWEVGEI